MSRPNSTMAGDSRAGSPPEDQAPRILVVDDEQSIRTIVGYALTHQGWQVTSVQDGSDVAEVIAAYEGAEAPFDLAILDLDMPQVRGYETYRRIKEQYPGLPVLFMSGWPKETVWQDMGDVKAEFMAKPFSIKYLVAKVRVLLTSAQSRAQGKRART